MEEEWALKSGYFKKEWGMSSWNGSWKMFAHILNKPLKEFSQGNSMTNFSNNLTAAWS